MRRMNCKKAKEKRGKRQKRREKDVEGIDNPSTADAVPPPLHKEG